MSDTRLLLRGGTVLSMVRGKADVLIENGRIAAIGPDLDIDAEIVDVDEHIVMPGFVDAHRHPSQAQLRNVTHSWSLLDYVRSVRVQVSPLYTPEDLPTRRRTEASKGRGYCSGDVADKDRDRPVQLRGVQSFPLGG